MSNSETQSGSDAKNIGRFLRLSEVEDSVGLRKTKIYELIKDKSDPFPSPIHIGARSVWAECEVNAWKANRLDKARQRHSLNPPG